MEASNSFATSRRRLTLDGEQVYPFLLMLRAKLGFRLLTSYRHDLHVGLISACFKLIVQSERHAELVEASLPLRQGRSTKR